MAKNLRGAPPAFRQAIEALEPWWGGNDSWLADLHWLDIVDKHQAIPVATFMQKGIALDFTALSRWVVEDDTPPEALAELETMSPPLIELHTQERGLPVRAGDVVLELRESAAPLSGAHLPTFEVVVTELATPAEITTLAAILIESTADLVASLTTPWPVAAEGGQDGVPPVAGSGFAA